jgi:hypothetical protein
MYATHPPLEDRIRAILPNWDGDYLVSDWDKTRIGSEEAKPVGAEANSRDTATAILVGTGGALLADAIVNQAGNSSDRHLQYADSIVRQIPRLQLDAAREPSGARAVMYQLVLSNTKAVRAAQLEYLRASADIGIYQELQSLLNGNNFIDAEQRLPLTTIALSSLRQLSQKQYQRFKSNFKELIEIDAKINLLEWALQRIVFHHLDVVFEKSKIPHFGKKNLSACKHSVAVLLSILAHSNSQDGISRKQAFAAGIEGLQLSATLIDVGEINFEVLNGALDELIELKPLQKPALLKACVSCIAADKEFMPIEVELLRAIAAVLDCPVPPLVAS